MKNKKFKLESFNNEQVKEINNVENLVIRNYELEQEVFKAINLAHRATIKGASTVIGISNVYTQGISLESNRITTDKAEYWPLRLTIAYELAVPKKRAFGTMDNREYFEFYGTDKIAPIYIDALVKPSNNGIASLFEKIFTSEFPGTFTIKYGRYVFCIDQLPTDMLSGLLVKAKTLRQIDLSWIAPLQDLIEGRESTVVGTAVKKMNNAIIEENEAEVPPAEVSDSALVSFSSAKWSEPQIAKKVSKFHIPHSSSGLMDAIAATSASTAGHQFSWEMTHSQAKTKLKKLIEEENKAKINKELFK